MHITSPEEKIPSKVVAFRDARWNSRWLVVGLTVLLLWRSLTFVDREWLHQFSPWLIVIMTGLVPQVFLLIFPVLTRSPNRRDTFGVPSPVYCLIEFGIAIPFVIGTVVVLVAIDFLIARISPGTSITPHPITNMARSPDRVLALLSFLFAFTFAPIAEEVFFRGFLYNAFRVRMPVLIAGLLQTVIFGLAHNIGAMYVGVTFAMGLMLTALYEWRKTLIAPILVHAGINFIAVVGMVVAMVEFSNGGVLGVSGKPDDKECVIHHVAPDSAAEEAGLQVGDIIKSFNTEPIRDYRHLVETVPRYRPGDAIPVTINRSGLEFEVTVVLRQRGDQAR